VGAVGAKLLYANGTIQHAGVILGLGGLAAHSHKFTNGSEWGYFGRSNLTQTLSAVTAACLLVRKSVYEQVGGLDEVNLTVAYNDVDFCLKVREAGYRNIYTPYATLYHHESISRGQENTPEKQARFMREFTFMQKKWGDLLKTDPYYNPNLTQTTEDFGLGNHEVMSPHHGYPLKIN
jgi:GT2 family glycosyltransferase